MSERGENIGIPENDLKKEIAKSRLFKEKKYYVATLDYRLRGDNQEDFVAHPEQIIINGKKRNIFIPEENVLLYLGGYKTIRESTPIVIKKLK